MKAFFHSLRFKALIITVFSFSALFLLVIYNTHRLLDAVARENIRSNILQTAETMNLAIAPYVTVGDLDTLGEYLGELISGEEEGIVYLALLDDQGKPLMQTGTAPDPLPEPTPEEQYHRVRTVHLQQATLLDNNRVGTLRFAMTWERLHDGLDRVNREIFALLSGGFVFMTLLVLLLGIGLSNRITQLMLTSRRLADGDYRVRVRERGGDELGALAHDFNHMAEAVEDRVAALERSRKEVQQLNENLEQRVRERTAELAAAVDNLEKTQKELVRSEKLAGLGSIVAAVAHELNTPIGNALTVATSFAGKARRFRQEISGGLKRSALNSFQSDVDAAVELIERNLGKAAELITSFKHVAIDQSSSMRREFDMANTLTEILATLRPTFKKTGHRIEVELEQGIRMNSYPGPLGQIVTNFINNALLHGFAGIDSGLMRLICRHHHDGWIELIFSDDGRGITEEHLNHIFDPFFTTQLGKGGSGLGLHIVHNIVTGLLGGSITAHSAKGEGTRFTLFLPLTAPDQADATKDKLAYGIG